MDTHGRGAIIYMLRTAQQHHVQLSLMADQKANALIAACFVTLSITVTYGASHVLTPALMAIMAFAMFAAFFAVLAVMPRVNAGQRLSHTRNLLFFGDFSDLTLDQYLDGMAPLLDSDESAYRAILSDIYCIGRVLMQRKYRFLRLAYACFLCGLVLAPALWSMQALSWF